MVAWASAQLALPSVALRVAASKCLAFLRELRLAVRSLDAFSLGRRRCQGLGAARRSDQAENGGNRGNRGNRGNWRFEEECGIG